jgi:hypothetical protein
MKNPDFDNTTFNQNPLVLKEVHYYISDDKTHDNCLSTNMSWPYTWNIWKVRDVILKNTSYGTMGVLHNSKVHEHGIMLLGIRILWFVNKGSRGCKCARFFLHMVMERARLMVQMHSWNKRFTRSKSKHMQWGYKMHMMLSLSASNT